MFLLIPWKVDVPQERWPIMNWLIMAALIGMFALQVTDTARYANEHRTATRHLHQRHGVTREHPSDEPNPLVDPEFPGLIGNLLLRGWNLKGLFGHMWLHGSLFHLGGNLLFLWLFGNAVCAKLGNLRYLILYVLCGVTAGMAHLLFSSHPALGASGAINGVVGMYLVLFYENEITCLFVWFPPPYARWFDVSSFWMILYWLFWDIVGAMRGRPGTAYFAHVGGFATGFALVMFMCWRGWITMERYEQSLLQAWYERKNSRKGIGFDAEYARLGLPAKREIPPVSSHTRTVGWRPILPPELELQTVRQASTATSIRTRCPCGEDIRVSGQYAQRTARCPNCDRHVIIPQATDVGGSTGQPPRAAVLLPDQTPNHTIHFACACGKRIKVSARYAGRFGKCPRCGLHLKIPPARA